MSGETPEVLGMRPEAEGWMPKFGGGHQEVDRIMDEVEAIYNSQPGEVRRTREAERRSPSPSG